MKITVLALFRDSELYIHRTLAQLEALESNTDAEFEFFFYENDSIDNTVSILTNWTDGRKARLLSETLGKKKFSQSTSSERMNDLVYYRNKLLEFGPFDSEYTLLVDTDVIFDENLINNYLPYLKDNVVMVTPNILQNIPCKMGEAPRLSYYDSWALRDKHGNGGMTWAANPFYLNEDRDLWASNRPVPVNSAFGGTPLLISFVLNQVSWSTNGGCEHWAFCEQVRKFGNILVLPDVLVKVYIDNIIFPNEDTVVLYQKKNMKWLNGGVVC